MKVFKFGGASVKDASAVKNVAHILSLYKREKVTVVISAMGKTTNATEAIVDALWNKEKSKFEDLVEERRNFHLQIMDELFVGKENLIYNEIATLFNQLKEKTNLPISFNYNFEYDQIVSLGEIASTKIVTAYLQQENVNAKWAVSYTQLTLPTKA